MPSISALLQHQSQDTRGRAAMALALISTASPNAVASAVLTSPEGLLGHMLTHLSGDDTSKNRSFYATLIGQCALVYDSAGLKKIGDAGAVPYLLKLLKEADKSSQQRVLGSLAVGWQLHNIQWPLGNFGHTWPLRIAFACNQSSLSTAGMLLARRLTLSTSASMSIGTSMAGQLADSHRSPLCNFDGVLEHQAHSAVLMHARSATAIGRLYAAPASAYAAEDTMSVSEQSVAGGCHAEPGVCFT